MNYFYAVCNVVTITNAFVYKFLIIHIATHTDTHPHTPTYHWIWYFGEIFQATGFRKEFINHIIIVCHLFLQQVLCEIWERSNVD